MPPAPKPLKPPQLPPQLSPASPTRLDGLELEASRLDGCTFANERGARVRFDGVRVAGGTIKETKMGDLAWSDVLCERCDLSMIDWPAAKLSRVEIRGCRMTGAKIVDGDLYDVRFVECQLDYALFSDSRFKAVSFEGCRLREADFAGADLAGGVTFVDCELSRVDLRGAKLKGVDLTASAFAELRVGTGDVRGLVVNRAQAAALAALFGIVVRDG